MSEFNMNYKQAKQIDLFLEVIRDARNDQGQGTINILDLKKQNPKLDKLSLEDLKKIIAIIRSKQIKLGTIFINGFGNSFIQNKEQINDLLLNGGFKKIYLKSRVDLFFIYIIPLVTLLILIWSEFIKESNLPSKKYPESNTIQQQPQKEVELSNKKADSSTQAQTDFHLYNQKNALSTNGKSK